LFDPLLSLKNRPLILETKSHFTPELLMCSRWPHYEQPCLHSSLTWMTVSNSILVSTKISFIYLLFILDSRFACVLLLPFTPCCIMSTSCCPCISGISYTDYSFLCQLLTGFPTYRFLEQRPSTPSLKIFWMYFYSQYYDGWL